MSLKLYPMFKKTAAAAALVLFTGASSYAQCTPVVGATAPCTNGTQVMRINSVSTTGGIFNINNANGACSSPGYTSWPASGSNVVQQNAGSTFNMTVSAS